MKKKKNYNNNNKTIDGKNQQKLSLYPSFLAISIVYYMREQKKAQRAFILCSLVLCHAREQKTAILMVENDLYKNVLLLLL